MRRNIHFIVPKKALKLITQQGDRGTGGAAALAEYRFGSGAARHLFCARCGISPFYQPRSNPDGWAITFPCLDGGTVSSVEVRQFDGLHWEEFYAGKGSAIKSFSTDDDDATAADATTKAAEGAASAEDGGAPTAPPTRAPPSLARTWLYSLLEILVTFLLPVVLIFLAVRFTGPKRAKSLWYLPGKAETLGTSAMPA